MRLLIVGKLQGHIGAASRIAIAKGAAVNHAHTIDEALQKLRSGQGSDLLMVEVSFNIKGMVQSLYTERFNIPVVACGIGTDSAIAVQAIKDGAKEYVPLPPDADLIAAVLESVAVEDNSFVHKDSAMVQISELAKQIAPSDASVLITGESGTGKEIMAQFIHQNSKRSAAQFVSVNCAAIPENLLESELFGHEKGAFTGAIAQRIGKFEEASGGTLLLDEVSEMHPSLQAKLLRALQERTIDRVGGNKPVKVDIRIIATSNRDLEESVTKGEFREDLYFRLNVVPLKLPPLRSRPMDIEILASHFIEKYTKANALPLRYLAEDAKMLIRKYMWPGNIRELENVMHRSVLLAQGETIQAKDLNIFINNNTTEQVKDSDIKSNILVGRTISDVEKDLIISTLSHCLGNRTHAANILGISIRTLRNKLKLYVEQGQETLKHDEVIASPTAKHGNA